MTFFSRELSQALQEAGCVSTFNFWMRNNEQDPTLFYFPNGPDLEDRIYFTQLLHPWDLCGPTEQARGNAMKWFGEEVVTNSHIPDVVYVSKGWKERRHDIIDLKTNEEVEAYVWKSKRVS